MVSSEIWKKHVRVSEFFKYYQNSTTPKDVVQRMNSELNSRLTNLVRRSAMPIETRRPFAERVS